jgi:hypothetical protein
LAFLAFRRINKLRGINDGTRFEPLQVHHPKPLVLKRLTALALSRVPYRTNEKAKESAQLFELLLAEILRFFQVARKSRSTFKVKLFEVAKTTLLGESFHLSAWNGPLARGAGATSRANGAKLPRTALSVLCPNYRMGSGNNC